MSAQQPKPANRSEADDGRYQALFENSADAVLVSDAEGKIYAANPQACAMFGYDEAEIRRLGRAGLVDPTDTRLAELLSERDRTGLSRGELRYVRKDGSKFSGEVSSVHYRDGEGGARRR